MLFRSLITVPYLPLSQETLVNIIKLQFERIRQRITASHAAEFSYDDDAIQEVISRCNATDTGGRMIDAVLTNTVLPEISRRYLQGVMQGEILRRINLKASGGDFIYQFETEPARQDKSNADMAAANQQHPEISGK